MSLQGVLPQKKIQRKSIGCFAKMGLDRNILRGITSCGYRLPTPIQRKCIPLAMEDHDIIAMARTGMISYLLIMNEANNVFAFVGSGKSAAFIIPILQKLRSHSLMIGTRALIMTPTRDLAIQLSQFVKKLSKYQDLVTCVICGGEPMDSQFQALSFNPDIIIASPGRLSYLLKEVANLSFCKLQFLVFDEADRLFQDMSFAGALDCILRSVFSSHQKPQIMLFSATMPTNLMDFTRAKLRNPIIIRLDSEMAKQIAKCVNIQHLFVHGPNEHKMAALLFLLQQRIFLNCNTKVVVFAGHKYFVEYISKFLKHNMIRNVCCYGSMDMNDRKRCMNIFRAGTVSIMIVTDVVARGIDIPDLDYVINFQMPTSTKNFIHRIGRVGRNGRHGQAFNLINAQEFPYFLDIQNFFQNELKLDQNAEKHSIYDNFGAIPLHLLNPFISTVVEQLRMNHELNELSLVSERAMDIYNRTKKKPSQRSMKKSKQERDIYCSIIHPFFKSMINGKQLQTNSYLMKISKFKSNSTVFEIGGASNPNYNMMQNSKQNIKKKKKRKLDTNAQQKKSKSVFQSVNKYRDEQYFISDSKNRQNMNAILNESVNNDNNKSGEYLKRFILDLDADERKTVNTRKKMYKFNERKRKYVTEFLGDRMNRFLREKNEANHFVDGRTYKYGKLYQAWKMKSKREISVIGSREKTESNFVKMQKQRFYGVKRYRHTMGSESHFATLRERKKEKYLKNEIKSIQNNKRETIKKVKRERFRKWWSKNKSQVKNRKRLRKMLPY